MSDHHSDNITVQRFGLGFDLKLLDMFHWGKRSAENVREDVVDMVKLFYQALGERRFYARQPRTVKEICCGLKRNLITSKFRSAAALCAHLERFQW